MKVKVTPTHANGYVAPYLIIETKSNKIADAYNEGIKEAKKKSRLSDFNCWVFFPEIIFS